MYKRRTIAETLALLIKHDDNISQGALERASGVNQPTINRILTGQSAEPKLQNLEKLATYFHVTVDQLRGKDPISWIDAPIEASCEEGEIAETNGKYTLEGQREQRLLAAIRQLTDKEQEALMVLLTGVLRGRR